MKVICLGFFKTGTKTLAEVFHILNMNVNGNPQCDDINHPDYIIIDNIPDCIKYHCGDEININDLITNFNGFHDFPYNLYYKEIYNNYPDSKFILTLRDEELWFKSISNYQHIPGAMNLKFNKYIFGHETFSDDNKQEIISVFKKHNDDVIKFFSHIGELNKLLIIDITKNTGESNWNEITKFLGIDNIYKDVNFPVCNKQTYKN